MSESRYDLAILGAGSGGMAAARRARESGLDVVLFEERRAGGTCVNRGCIPKKLMVHASRQGGAIAASEAFGWTTGERRLDWPTLRDAVQAQVREIADSQRESLLEAGVRFVDRRATLVAADRLRDADGEEYRARHVIVATGSRPLLPGIPGEEHALVSDDLFELEALPERIALVGGGYIAIEFACMLERFGVDVAIFESSERILDGFAGGLAEALQSRMREDGIDIHTGAEAARIEKADGRHVLVLDSGARHEGFDAIALVVGRAPNTEEIGLETLGVALDDKGQIKVDAYGRTNVSGVHAVGDVARQPQLTPVAIADGRNVVDGILGRAFEAIPPDRIPTAVYATPELGSVGLSSEDARARGLAAERRTTRFGPTTHMLESDASDTLVELVVERGSGTMLGFHACGENAAEMAQLAAVMVEAGVTADVLARTIKLHPSDAEEVVGLGTAEADETL